MQNNQESVNIEMKMDKNILFRYMMSNSWLTSSGKLKWIVTAIAMFLLIYYLIIGNMDTSVVLLGLILVYNLVFQPMNYYFSAQKQLIQNKNFSQPIKYSISNEGVYVEQSAGKGTVNWSMLLRVVETRKLFLLYLSANQALIISKSFMDETGIKKAREIINNHRSEIKKVRLSKV